MATFRATFVATSRFCAATGTLAAAPLCPQIRAPERALVHRGGRG